MYLMIPQVKIFTGDTVSGMMRKASFICLKCLLMFLSLLFFVWGAFAYVPTQGHSTGYPSILEKVQHRLVPKLCPYAKDTNVVEY
jgi:hypothetical protein